jgi:hypothetical protein
MVSRHGDLRGAARRGAGRRCRGDGRFPYIGMSGDLIKIVATDNGMRGSFS